LNNQPEFLVEYFIDQVKLIRKWKRLLD
jgi:hypothetical protein